MSFQSLFYEKYHNHYVIGIHSCVVIDAVLRSVIYDLQRNDFQLVPPNLINMAQIQHKKVSELVLETDLAVIEFLHHHEYIFLSPHADDAQAFQAPDLTFKPAYWFNNAIVLWHKKTNKQDKDSRILQPLADAGIKHIVFYARETIGADDIAWILQEMNTSAMVTVEFIIPDSPSSEAIDFMALFRINPRIKKITFFGAGEMAKPFDDQPVFYITADLSNSLLPKIAPGQMVPDLEVFKESLVYNVFYNGKLLTDFEGNLYDSICFDRVYYNILQRNSGDMSLLENKKYAQVCKDQVDVCRVCEYRYMCIDSEVPVQRASGSWFRQTECQYNPYIAKWDEEEGFLPLAECGITCNYDGFFIDQNRLNHVQQHLYPEDYSHREVVL